MNPKQSWTSTRPRLAPGCALSVLLVAGAGCAEDLTLDPGERPDNLDRSGRPAAYADAGAASDAPINVSCEGDLPKPHPGPGISDPPKPVEADAGAAPDAGAVQDCFGHLLGDGETCMSEADLKLQAERLCYAKGFELAGLKLGEADCAGGSTEGWVSCCASDAPRSSGPTACTGGVIGDGTTCIDWDALKLKASGACEGLGLSLAGLAGSSDDACSGGARSAKYECCSTIPQPPKPVDLGQDPWLK